MPRISKQSSKHDDYGPVESWHEEVDGNAIEFEHFKQDIDSTPMLKGLPDDQCHCPHWGYVLKGKVTFTVDGKEEVMEPGDAFYMPPEHLYIAPEICIDCDACVEACPVDAIFPEALTPEKFEYALELNAEFFVERSTAERTAIP